MLQKGGKIKELSLSELSEDMADVLSDFETEAMSAQQNLPADSPLRFGKPPSVIGYFDVKIKRGQSFEVALIEMKNRDGHFLTYDGQSLEVTSGGPAFVQVRTELEKGVEETPSIFYSPGAFQERLRTITHRYLPEVQATLLDDEHASLLQALALHIEIELSGEDSLVIPDPSELVYSGQNSDHEDSPHIFETERGPVAVKFELTKNGEPDFQIALFDA